MDRLCVERHFLCQCVFTSLPIKHVMEEAKHSASLLNPLNLTSWIDSYRKCCVWLSQRQVERSSDPISGGKGSPGISLPTHPDRMGEKKQDTQTQSKGGVVVEWDSNNNKEPKQKGEILWAYQKKSLYPLYHCCKLRFANHNMIPEGCWNQSLFRNRSDFDLISKKFGEWTSKLQCINRNQINNYW